MFPTFSFKTFRPRPFEKFLEIRFQFLLYEFNTLEVMVIVSIVVSICDCHAVVLPCSILNVGKNFSRTFLPLLHIDIPFSCNN
jgi:hypothetical protein